MPDKKPCDYLNADEVCARYGFTAAELWRRRLSGRFPAPATIHKAFGALWPIAALDKRDAANARWNEKYSVEARSHTEAE